MSIQGYSASEFTHEGVTKTVYRRGRGPGVIIITEVPGIHEAVVAFANLVADAGFTVVLPDLFGEPMKPVSGGYLASTMLKLCVSKEFKLLAGQESSPITNWLRGLARALHKELGGKGVGAIGMCLTGNFALSMAVEPSLMAPVMSQPALPLPVGKARRGQLAIAPDELATVKRRVKDEGLKVLGLCFTHDGKVPRERFETLKRELKEGFEAIEIDSGPGNAHGIKPSAHSVLTVDLVRETGHPTEQALQRTLSFLRERLQ
ncbi:dienelactone hydrolase family protein [Nannocystis pusilla]|uniref:Dienelactone hydrolase family protein n=1 Tax=Nannocystis pusilla TaxID=889268 RepID=A0A9X3EN50_9BACT|nr:dienelactone hydrolase family protein [Nannocystis pusilla]MCY1006860.1 dienelactone hydrolase family protein [Nannocystis pusilla]